MTGAAPRLTSLSWRGTREKGNNSMFIVGQTGAVNGKPVFGNMTQDQAVAWLISKDGRGNTIRQSMKTCVSGVMSDSGGPGGGNRTYSFDGLPMRHVSASTGAGNGVTLFYVARPGGIAKVIGIGYHIGAQTYDLRWKDHGWRSLGAKARLSLDG
jgi:hypothetical protein